MGRTVNIIVHTMAEVNQALTRGEYFWTDILRDGVTLYELPGHPFAQPQPMTAAEARDAAQRYYEARIKDLDLWIEDARRHVAMSGEGQHVRKRAAFLLHQATETAYACFLLTHTFYFPRSHNIKFLRSLAEDSDKRLAAAWPREQRADRRRFELLKRAYVEARYSDQYDVDAEDLTLQLVSVVQLRDLVAATGEDRIAELARGARAGA
ncbi:HEPN domain protein [compost metagenome]